MLLDLDGTVTDSAPGIIASLKHTFTTLGLPVPNDDELTLFVGPPLADTMRMHGGFNDHETMHAVDVYRDHYAGHALHAPVFPGMAGLIETLGMSSVPLSLATSKPESLATKILEHHGLAQHFDVICGASEDESRAAKSDIVAEALRRLRQQGADVSSPVMVGDRGYDAIGAAVNDVPTIMVEWGYGSPLEAGEAMAVVHSIDQLRALLLT
ncbi:HAD hydrolase-like protein [Agromyces rhizosphaerae]|uniref:HAD hydrolase-like protein n=1 Tax=Agromyces rhizosphaerae TaxID=88374 RepID=UPI002492F960|nr:HAD hydrolase-like protein [Agromyces rhizosphaerae]